MHIKDVTDSQTVCRVWGRALGLLYEHQHPDSTSEISTAFENFLRNNYNWDNEAVLSSLSTPVNYEKTDFDPKSVMGFPGPSKESEWKLSVLVTLARILAQGSGVIAQTKVVRSKPIRTKETFQQLVLDEFSYTCGDGGHDTTHIGGAPYVKFIDGINPLCIAYDDLAKKSHAQRTKIPHTLRYVGVSHVLSLNLDKRSARAIYKRCSKCTLWAVAAEATQNQTAAAEATQNQTAAEVTQNRTAPPTWRLRYSLDLWSRPLSVFPLRSECSRQTRKKRHSAVNVSSSAISFQ